MISPEMHKGCCVSYILYPEAVYYINAHLLLTNFQISIPHEILSFGVFYSIIY